MTFDEVRHLEPIVHRGLRAGVTLETIIVALYEQKQALSKRCMELESIAPRKIVGSDGKTLIWRCPDHLVPEP